MGSEENHGDEPLEHQSEVSDTRLMATDGAHERKNDKDVAVTPCTNDGRKQEDMMPSPNDGRKEAQAAECNYSGKKSQRADWTKSERRS